MRGQRLAFLLVLFVIIYLVLGPLGMLLVGSVRSAPHGAGGEWTLHHYRAVYGSLESYRLLGMSMAYAILASLLSFSLGVLLAWMVERTNTPLSRFFGLFLYVPVFVPTVLITLSWTMLLGPRAGLVNIWLAHLFGLPDDYLNIFSFGGMVWVKGIIDVPLVYLWLSPALRAMDPSLEEAAMMAGASRLSTLRRVTLPLVTPALLAAWLIAFVTALEDLAVPIFIGIPARIMVFSSEIWIATRRVPSNLNLASTYAITLVALTLAGILVYRHLTRVAGRFATVTGKGFRPRLLDLGSWRYLTAGLGLVLITVSVIVPLGLLVWNSFTPYIQVPSVEALQHLTVKHYMDLINNSMMVRGFRNSLLIGLAAGVAVMVFSAVVSWFVVRTQLRGRALADFLGFMPIAIPGIVVGLSLIWVYLGFRTLPIYGTVWILLVAYVTRFLPYGLRLAYSGLSQIHSELEEAAWVSGGNWLAVFRRITVPLLSPALVVGVCYVLLRAFRELPASLLLSGTRSQVFSVVVFDLWETGQVERLSAYGTVAIIILLAVIAAVRRFARRFDAAG